MTEIAVGIPAVFLILNYLMFLRKIWSGLRIQEQRDSAETEEPFVSVIIPFRNESANLESCIRSLLDQDYPPEKCQFIFTDDNSIDDFRVIFNRFNDSRILLLGAEAGSEGKKRAITAALAQAKGEIILSTDADCTHQRGWIKKMVMEFDPNTGFTAGLVAFNEGSSLMSKVQALEFGSLMITAAGLIKYGEPVICSAANIAYRKSAFNEVDGFADNIHLTSGDDEFLMRKIAATGRYKVKICTDPAAVVFTRPCDTPGEFINQRKRWASKGLHYESRILILTISLIFLFYLSLIILPVLFLISGKLVFLLTAIVMYAIKCAAEFAILIEGKKIYPLKAGVALILLTEILHVPYIVISSVLGAMGNYDWKERNIRR